MGNDKVTLVKLAYFGVLYVAHGWERSGSLGDHVILRNPHDFAAKPMLVTLVELLDRKPLIISPWVSA